MTSFVGPGAVPALATGATLRSVALATAGASPLVGDRKPADVEGGKLADVEDAVGCAAVPTEDERLLLLPHAPRTKTRDTAEMEVIEVMAVQASRSSGLAGRQAG